MSEQEKPHPPWMGPPETDGWIETYEPTEEGLSPTIRGLVRRPGEDGRLSKDERAARARSMAILCHMSVLFGFPIFLFSLFQRDDPFVLHHAKASGVAFVLFYGLLVLGIVVHPVLFLAMLATYLFPLVAIWRASKGAKAGWLGLGPIGEATFFPFQLTHASREKLLLENKQQQEG
ncbi:MAG: DUF4870 domain-containing protein [Myxococcota bacterium]|nr:DUF4870 domain-containing protein [Myxococcota bacterium]MEC9440537.1 DUF4870 domain-containing protein [Myxococcota bacterium]